jgi:Flp pilus assembly protein TadG
MRKFHIDAWSDERGTTAIEFAIVGPAFIILIIGIIYLCMALLTVGSLHYAVEDGARCASIRTAVCSDATTTVAYTQSRYFGPGSAPTFTYGAAACGKSVSGSINYNMDLGFKRVTVPIAATACFP